MENNNTHTSSHAREIIDVFTWEKYTKIITKDVHKVPGLGNFSHFSRTASQPPTPPHHHSEMLELHCVLKGRRESRIHHPDGSVETYSCMGNEAFIVFPGEIHSSGLYAQDPCETFAIQLNTCAPERLLGLSPHMAKTICERLLHMNGRKFATTSNVTRLLRNAFQLLTDGDRESAVAHLVCFLFEFVTMQPLEESVRTPGDPRIRRALDYISEKIDEPISVSDLANLSEYSLSRFKSKFREETGQTPGVYITAVKIEEAKRLLTDTNQSITEIAVNLGWSTANYFCSVFKKLTGVSPLHYRHNSGANGGK